MEIKYQSILLKKKVLFIQKRPHNLFNIHKNIKKEIVKLIQNVYMRNHEKISINGYIYDYN